MHKVNHADRQHVLHPPCLPHPSFEWLFDLGKVFSNFKTPTRRISPRVAFIMEKMNVDHVDVEYSGVKEDTDPVTQTITVTQGEEKAIRRAVSYVACCCTKGQTS